MGGGLKQNYLNLNKIMKYKNISTWNVNITYRDKPKISKKSKEKLQREETKNKYIKAVYIIWNIHCHFSPFLKGDLK